MIEHLQGRENALAPLGWTGRKAEWIALACLHGDGVFSRAQLAFCLQTVDLQVRPIYHRLGPRVRAHIFLCVLAYYAEWHMRRDWAPLLYGEDDPAGAQAARKSPRADARRARRAWFPGPAGEPGDPDQEHRPGRRRVGHVRAAQRSDRAAAQGV